MNAKNELVGGAISRAVAEEVGWRFEYAYVIGDDDANATRYYKVYDPEGKLITPLEKGWMHFDDEWPENLLVDAIPDYAYDLNAAITLTVKDRWLELESPFGKYGDTQWLASYNAAYSDDTVYGNSDDPAEAICKARLALAEHLKSASDKESSVSNS